MNRRLIFSRRVNVYIPKSTFIRLIQLSRLSERSFGDETIMICSLAFQYMFDENCKMIPCQIISPIENQRATKQMLYFTIPEDSDLSDKFKLYARNYALPYAAAVRNVITMALECMYNDKFQFVKPVPIEYATDDSVQYEIMIDALN